MLTTEIDGIKYEVRVEFDVEWTALDHSPVIIRCQQPTVRPCGCCDKCPQVERTYEEVRSFAEAIERGWLVPT